MRLLKRALVAALLLVGVIATPAHAAAPFKVLAFYNGTWDAAHIDFDKEAREWFPQAGAQNGFTWEATTDWSRLSASGLAGYKVIMFLDDAPPADRRAAFQQYMQNGGAWLGFHVSAFTTNANEWSWYYNTFLGSGNFATNTWGPTAETLRLGQHPTTAGLPATIPSAVSEWYSWSRDLRQNPDIDILASIDATSFPVGTDPNQQWRSGFYPLIWSNRNYKMVYTNFGHNGMNYETNTRTSSTFASAQQNQWLINSILWLGGGSPAEPPALVNKNSGKCVAAGTTNGSVVQQTACTGATAQQFQLVPTSDGYVRINGRGNPAQVLDVTNVSTADNAPIQTWAYGGGANQQWRPVDEGGGYYHYVNRGSGKCLDVPAASTADGVQLVQYACNGTGAQSFRSAR
ncbi:ThuA domain-containing protein [Paractinoplanes lichenicola]|uniref:ThuA domain-containing protein n=1 Tax=Paractinoplanes lichenicola TaxID=2802976 RepID=A0ABS1VY23_9ACTN|nr:ThuA domain-containing protein [Actinoplanes lichenicola]MBL7259399.1 ThuA domain-containing protein [Actinoplanes lichenicola]